jgi:predicted nucleotidyltransferase
MSEVPIEQLAFSEFTNKFGTTARREELAQALNEFAHQVLADCPLAVFVVFGSMVGEPTKSEPSDIDILVMHEATEDTLMRAFSGASVFTPVEGVHFKHSSITGQLPSAMAALDKFNGNDANVKHGKLSSIDVVEVVF